MATGTESLSFSRGLNFEVVVWANCCREWPLKFSDSILLLSVNLCVSRMWPWRHLPALRCLNKLKKHRLPSKINQMNPLLFCLQKLWKTGLFHQLSEPLKILQTISNSNQTIHKTVYLMKMDKSGPKNNNFGSLIWKGGSGVLTTISVGFHYFPKLSRYLYDHKSRYLYDHKSIKLAARYHKFEIKQFYVFLFLYFIGQILPRTISTMEYDVKNVMVFKAAAPSCFRD